MRIDHMLLARKSSLWAEAFGRTSLTTVLCVLVVGCWFVPLELARQQTGPRKRIESLAALAGGDSFVALIAETDMRRSARSVENSLVVFDSLGQSVAQTLSQFENPQCFALNNVNSQLFVGDKQGRLLVAELRPGTRPVKVLGNNLRGCPEQMICAPDGRTLLTCDKYNLSAWSCGSDLQLGCPLWCHVDSNICCVAIHPDSKTALCGRINSGHTELLEFDLQTGKAHVLLEFAGQRLNRLAISNNGRFLAGVEDISGKIALFEKASGSEPWQPCSIEGLRTGASCIACFSPSSDVLITTNSESRQLVAWDLCCKKLRQQFDKHSTKLIGCEFLDERRIVFSTLDGTLRVLNLYDPFHVQEIRL